MRGSRRRWPARLASRPPVVGLPAYRRRRLRGHHPRRRRQYYQNHRRCGHCSRWGAATVVPVAVAVGVNGRHPDRHTHPPRVGGGVARSAARGGPVSQREEA